MLKILKNKKGITLIELMVGMLLFAIAAAATSAILAPMLRAYERANDFAECNTLLDNIANQMVSDLSESVVPLEDITTLPTTATAANGNSIIISNVIYSISDTGVLLRNGEPVLSKIYYKNKSVGFSCGFADDTTGKPEYILTVSIFSDRSGAEMMQRDYAVSPICLNPY